MLNEVNDAVKCYYEPHLGYRLFTKDGEEIPFLMGCTVSIDDNFNKGAPYPLSTCQVSFIVEVVNELPKKKNLLEKLIS